VWRRGAAKGFVMVWERPHAIDLRFGFEITMYVAAR
jgi:coenzyme PQQ precursor peptide PqqA